MYPEDEEEQNSIISIATPGDAGTMPAANYQIAGPLAEHKPDTRLEDAAIKVGANAAGKGVEGTLFGGGPEGTFFERGLWGLGGGAGSATMPAAAGANMAATAGNVANAATIANAAGASGAAGAAGLGGGMMAALASNPVGWAIGAGMLAKKFGLFNKGGGVGPLSPQYKEHGGSSYREDFPGIGGFSMLRPFVKGVDSLTSKLFGYDRYPHSSDNSSAMYTGQSWNEMGPLSQEKTKPQSTKIEKKETIEYKN